MTDRLPRRLLVGLYLLGVVHWLCFFYLTYPPGGDRAFLTGHAGAPAGWFVSRAFSAHDWGRELSFYEVLRQALRTGTVPFHMPELDKFRDGLKQRFLGLPVVSLSPQIVLLTVLEPFTFCVVNLLLVYSIGFYGCWRFSREYGLGPLPFVLLFLLVNCNGYFVEKVAAYGPGQLGYFLLPWALWVMWRTAAPEAAQPRSQWRWGVSLGVVLAAILYQGSHKFFVDLLTFLLIWTIANPRLWRVGAMSAVVSCSLAAVRLLPAAVTFGAGPNSHAAIWSGYRQPEAIVEALVLTRTQLSSPLFSWWEYSLYVSIVGGWMLWYFGVWGPFMQRPWARSTWWRTMAVPCLVMVGLSTRQWRNVLIPSWIPLLNGESMPTRYMVVPLLVTIVVAAAHLEAFWRTEGHRLRVRVMLRGCLVVLAGFLVNHSRLWRMPRVQAEFDLVTTMEDPLKGAVASQVIPVIRNNMADTVYIASWWIGVAVSALTALLLLWWFTGRRAARRSTQLQPGCP